MNDKELSSQLYTKLGGNENVVANDACMTRLRIRVKDTSKVDMQGIKELDGVMSTVEGDPVQIVLGPGRVNKVLDEFSQISGLAKGQANEDLAATAHANKAAQKAKYSDKPVQAFLKKIASIFVALLPGIIAAGLINGISNVINVATGNAFTGDWWYQGIRSMGWALFAYLPIMVGYNAAREFGGSASLGGIAGALCIANAAMPLLAPGAADPEKAILLPLTGAAYNPAAGGMIAALIAGAFFAVLEQRIRKIMPNTLDTFLSPLLVLIIGSFAMMLVIQPLGAWLTTGIFAALNFAYGQLGVLGGYLLSAGFLPLVSVGLHQALTPIHALLNDPNGATQGVNYLLPILMMAGGGQVGAGFALYLKTKNSKLRRFISESIPVGILGIGEPMMYAVTLPLVRPFITACLGAGVGGALAALFHIGTVSQGVSGLFGLLIVVPGQQIFYVIAMLAAYLGGFVLTWFFGVDEQRINEFYGE